MAASGAVKVLGKGKLWTDLAFVSSDWYITAYQPIEAISGARAGMIYVGVLEEKYADIRRQILTIYSLVTIAVMLVAARELGAKHADLVAYGTSGDVTGDNRQVVGYAAVAVW